MTTIILGEDKFDKTAYIINNHKLLFTNKFIFFQVKIRILS